MIVSDPGHAYNVLFFDPEGKEPAIIPRRGSSITFFKKIGEKFPGNEGSPSWGTNCQEVLRVLIHRTIYLHNQIPCREFETIIFRLRQALHQFEHRTARVKGQEETYRNFIGPRVDMDLTGIEDLPFCNVCGHIYPHSHVKDKSP